MILLAGCVESFAVMSTGAVNGKLVQSSVNTGISYGIKSQTGMTPVEHALAYTKKNKSEEKKKPCALHANKKDLNVCLKLKEKMAANQFEKKKSPYETSNKITPLLQSSINKKFKIKYLD